MNVNDLDLLSIELERATNLLRVGIEEFEAIPNQVNLSDKNERALLIAQLTRNPLIDSLLYSALYVIEDVIKDINSATDTNIKRSET